MGRLSVRNQLYIAIAVTVVVTLALVFFLILPLFEEASVVDATISAELDNLASAQALLARRQSAKAGSAADEVELMRIANEVPDSPQLPSVIIELQDVANGSGLDLITLQPGGLELGKAEIEGGIPQYSAVPINLELEGDWADYIDFFRRVENLNRGTRVVGATFSYYPKTDDKAAHVAATIDIEVYVTAVVDDGVLQSETTTQTP